MLDCHKLGFGFLSFLDNESIIGQNLSFGVSTERPSNTKYTSKSYIMFKLKRKGYSGLLLCEVFLGGTGGIYVKSQVEKRAVKAIIKYQLVFYCSVVPHTSISS